jgi:hypothetical protein
MQSFCKYLFGYSIPLIHEKISFRTVIDLAESSSKCNIIFIHVANFFVKPISHVYFQLLYFAKLCYFFAMECEIQLEKGRRIIMRIII